MAGYNRFNKISVIIFLVVILIMASVVYAGEWMTFKGGVTRTSFTTQVIEPQIRKVAWSVNCGSAISSSPVVKSNSVYFGTEGDGQGTFYCIENGRKVWEFPDKDVREYVDRKTGEKPWPNGAMDFPRTTLKITATIMGRTLYIPWGSMLLLVNVDTGNLTNHIDLNKLGQQGSINTSPFVSPSHRLIICGSTNGYLYGFDHELREPAIRWRIPDGGSGGTISSSVAYSNRRVFFGSTSKKFYCYELSYVGAEGVKAGQNPPLKWEKKLAGQIISTPAVSGNTVITTTRDGYVYALSTVDGKEIWKVNTGSRIDASPAISGSSVVVVAGKFVKCFNIKDGKQKWSSVVGNMCYATPIVNNKYVYVACYDGKFYVFRIDNGALMGAKKIGPPIKSSPSIANGKIFFGAQNGYLYALEHGDEPPNLKVSQEEINISHAYNDEVVPVDDFYIDNSGGGTLDGSVTFSRDWVTTTNSSFKISADDGDQVPLRINTVGQIEGQYKIMMKVQSNGGNKNIPIVINIQKRPDTIINLTIGSPVIKINSEPVTIEAAPWRTSNGIVMVPLRVITESFGCSLRYTSETRSIHLIYNKKNMTLTLSIGSRIAFMGYGNRPPTPIMMDYNATIVEDRTFVPLYFIVRAFDAEVTSYSNGNSFMIVVKHN